ncbi:protein maelstrom homolog [Hyperolius riggenbachi]|uniref:protein maelstrom homolog n=1 Tax=Hyperolius riggenbachi TaxID=752182 RepID=UPI0035A37E7D
MPNKKASRNAYFFFALEMIPRLRQRGQQVSGVREAIPLVSEDWARLTAEEKERYATKAKEWKSREADPPSPREDSGRFLYTESPSLAAQVSEVLARHQEEVSKKEERLCKKIQELESKVISILNIFSHGEMPPFCEQRFVPCEVGSVRYSLKDGILDSFHDFIDPGDLPLGFRYHCQAGSASTHQIPVGGFELANRDYYKLYRSLCSFLCPVPGLQSHIYCRNNDIFRVKWCLQWLANKAGMENHFEFLDIESLIIKYYRDKLGEEPSKSSVHRLLDVIHWDYADYTRCKWHEENDMWYCALASCKKVTYCMSNALASVYGITLTADHLPNLRPQESPVNKAKTIVLDARRYQKRADRRYFTEEFGGGDASSASSVGVKDASPVPPSRGRGRGILRLLENSPSLS